MNYPNKLTVIVPSFSVVTDTKDQRSFSQRLLFMTAFAVLHADRHDDGRIAFSERIELDPIGNGSIDLLTKLGNELDPEATLAGWRLDYGIGSLVRVPRDSMREAEGKTPLLQLSSILANEPIDVAWFDQQGGLPTLLQIAARYSLAAEWDQPVSSNPAILRQRLSARVRTIWAAVAEVRMPLGDDRRKAFASFAII